MKKTDKRQKAAIDKACAANGFSPAAAAAMFKWRANGRAAGEWLERYQQQAKGETVR